MPRPLTFTAYRNATDTQSHPITQSWEDWIPHLTKHEIRPGPQDKASLDRAKNGPAIVLGEIPADKPRKGSNVRKIDALSLDIENLTDEQIQTALQPLAPFEWVAYTTHKSGSQAVNGQTRLRVVIPLAESVEPSDFSDVWEALNAMIGGVNDPQTRDVGRLNFLPSTFDISKANAIRHPGRWLHVNDLPKPTHVPQTDSLTAKMAADTMKRKLRVLDKSHEAKAAALALCEGQPLALAGSRHEAIRRLTWEIARKDPRFSQEALRILFCTSVAAMQAQDASSPGIEDVISCFEGAVSKQAEELKAETQRIQTEAAGAGPYNQADLERIAQNQSCHPEQLRDRWILQRDTSFWVLCSDGAYHGPHSINQIAGTLPKKIGRAPIRLVDVTRNGVRHRAVVDIVRDHGSVAESLIADLTLQHTRWDPVLEQIREAVCPIKRLEPHFDQDIDKWLQLLGGSNYMKLVDWLSCAPDLKKLLCAIYFAGEGGAGKTLFARGVGSLWNESPADIMLVLSDFNQEIARCPLVLADETLPRHWKGSAVTTALRSMISTVTRTLNRKYQAPTEMYGAIRLILTANNEFLLDSRDVSSTQDLDAIAQRFLYIKVEKPATEYLNSLPRSVKEEWATSGIARHALYLNQNYQVGKPGKRFWVEGDMSQMHRLLMTGSRWNSLVCQWLVGYCLNPGLYEARNEDLVKREGGELLVNDQALLDAWELYLPKNTKAEPELAKIGSALRAISKSGVRKHLKSKMLSRRIRYRVIDVDHLIAWADRFNIGDRETILDAVGEVTNVDVREMEAANREDLPV